MSTQTQSEKISAGQGFIAALDQSGGSTPKALRLYGVEEDSYASDSEMYDLIHGMRTRIAQAPAFTGDKVIGAILFENTMERAIDGVPTAQYIWEQRGVVPFLKVDKGLEDEVNGAQLMKPMPQLDEVCARAVSKGVFGTKMRSVINGANAAGIHANIAQQFDVAAQIAAHDLMPIIEPEVNITIADKAETEDLLLAELSAALDALPDTRQVMLKLTLPENPNQYLPLINHPRVLKVVALSGGYNRADANAKLAQNAGMIASFSRALTEGLSAQQDENAFNGTITNAIDSIYEASIAG